MGRTVQVWDAPFEGISGRTSDIVDLRYADAWTYSAITASGGTFSFEPQISLDQGTLNPATGAHDIDSSSWSALAVVTKVAPTAGPSDVRFARFVFDSNTTNVEVAVHQRQRT